VLEGWKDGEMVTTIHTAAIEWDQTVQTAGKPGSLGPRLNRRVNLADSGRRRLHGLRERVRDCRGV
jgi:hypothetical protein